MRKVLIGMATAALSLGTVGIADADSAMAERLPASVNYFQEASGCEVGPLNAVCFYTEPGFKGRAVGLPHGVDDVKLNGRWHFRSIRGIDGFAGGFGPTDGALMAFCWRQTLSNGAGVALDKPLADDEPFSVIGYRRASVSDPANTISVGVGCGKIDSKVDDDDIMRKEAKA